MKNKLILFLTTITILLNVFVLTTNAENYETWYVNASALNCRTEPNIQSDIITTFERNKELQIIGADGEWWQVYDENIQGWCYSYYLKPNINNESTYNQEEQIGEYLGNFKISYYTCSPAENGGSNLTAKGQALTDVVGIAIAADPRVVPYYSKVYIKGVGVRTVLDCGGAIKGNKIDVLVRNSNDIPACGIHYSDVYLLN